MKRAKMIALVVAGIVLPVALAFSAYLISRSTVGEAGTVPALDRPADGTPAASATPAPSPSESQKGPSESGATAPAPLATDDHGGKCSEPEHTADPSCVDGGSGGSGSSGSGGGGGDDSSNSGSGGSGGSGSSGSSGSGSSGGGGDD